MVHNRFSPTSSSNEHDRKITQIRTIIYMLMIIINHLNTFSSRENVILSPEGQFHKTGRFPDTFKFVKYSRIYVSFIVSYGEKKDDKQSMRKFVIPLRNAICLFICKDYL